MVEYILSENNDFLLHEDNSELILESSSYFDTYGVKYRLIFSDVLGHGKKVEILKKNYVGDVYPMIGGANPVKISWQSSDDFYKPIIGSKCQLSLMVTDDVSYDDFYKFDEREYKVKVYYAKSRGEIYSDRVIADGGVVESIECINNTLDDFISQSQQYDERVENDGGTIESLSCVSQAIDDGNFYEWGAYWSGFLVVDRYREKLISKPFGVTFNAFDGLGTLNNFNAPVKRTYDGTGVTNYYKDAERINLILDNLDLGLDVHYMNDIESDKITAGDPNREYFPEFRSIEPGLTEMIDGYDIPLAKDQLALLLSTYNMRIFQSMNKWHVVEATNLFDKYVKDKIFNEVEITGVTPTGIRNKITTQIQDTNKEFIKLHKYDTDGAFVETTNENVLFEVPSKLIPVKNDLVVEYLQGISQITTQSKNLNRTKAHFNAGFEYGSAGFQLSGNDIDGVAFPPTGSVFPINPFVIVTSDDNSYQGTQSLKTIATNRQSSATIFMLDDTTIGDVANDIFPIDQITKYSFSMQYKFVFDTSDDTGILNSFIIRIRAQSVTNPTTQWREFDIENKKWVSQPNGIDNIISQEDFNKYKELSFDFTDTDFDQVSALGNVVLKIQIQRPDYPQGNTDYVETYFDNVILRYENNLSEEEITSTSFIDNNKLFTTNKNVDRLFQEQIQLFKRSRDSFGTFTTTNLFKTNYDIQNQNIANDFKDFVPRYTGTFRVNQVTPFSMHNKIWFNWSTIDSDPQSTIIDSMTYDVKDAQIKIKSHLPNDDDDVSLNTVTK